jgi:N4-gp56 family major capsid protein
MAILRFRPEIWSAELLVALQKSLVFAQPGIVNRDYEGEIQDAGDTVRITSISDPTIGTYTANSTTITPEELTDAQRTLVIDQAKYFAFYVDDIDKRQAKGDVMPEAMRRAAYKLRDVVDQYVAAFYTSVQTANRVNSGSAVAITTGALAYTNLVALGTELDEANVGSEGRWAVLPPWYHGLLLDNVNFINAEKSADGGMALRNGFIGRAAGFDLYKSNNVVTVTGDDDAIMAGVPQAISYAEQINKVEAYRPESKFADAVKGLHLWGAKVVRPECLAYLLASRT